MTLLRQIQVGIANGNTTPQVCSEAESTVQTYYRWRKENGGLKLDPAPKRGALRFLRLVNPSLEARVTIRQAHG